MNYLPERLSARLLCFTAATCFGFCESILAQDGIDEILILGDFSPVTLLDADKSVSVITADGIENRQASFLTEALGAAPNLNYSSGASRGRYFQIRGIGERSQFIDPINPGVGLMIDGIDYSTLGAAASLLDVAQVEVYRGPQGTLFGANALAGLINLQSNAATNERSLELGISAGDLSGNRGSLDSTRTSLVANQPLADQLYARFAFQQNQGDGPMENSYLERDDTQKIDETTARLKLRWDTDQHTSDLTLLKLDFDNGYDAFTLNNSRQSLADQPGRDSLDSQAISLDSRFELQQQLELRLLLSASDAQSEYSYDEDWTNPDICAGQACAGWEYSSFDQYLRDTRNQTADVRLQGGSGDSHSWVTGIYLKQLEVDLERNYSFAAPFDSKHQQDNRALYGELQLNLSSDWKLTLGARVEQFESDYRDSLAQRTNTDENLWGGNISLAKQLEENASLYARIARGYKSGGINVARGSSIPLQYKTENLLNYELGYSNQWNSQLQGKLVLFYQDRRNAQVKQSLVTCPPAGGSCSFDDFVDNAAEAHGYGLEADLVWDANERLQLAARLGVLETAFDDYLSFSHVNAVDNGTSVTPYDMSGEPLAQSPSYQLTLEAQWSLNQRSSLWVSLEAKDNFRFSNRHLAQADAYQTLNARWSWQQDSWALSLWGRNLTDETYATRGFGSFPNDPRDFYTSLGPYVQLGEPRHLGVSFNYSF